ncbi:MAG: hypothetical protein ABW140_04315 [Candidatus Sedimenticola sp. 6PFRAG1]
MRKIFTILCIILAGQAQATSFELFKVEYPVMARIESKVLHTVTAKDLEFARTEKGDWTSGGVPVFDSEETWLPSTNRSNLGPL